MVDVFSAVKSVLGAPPTTGLVKAPPSIVATNKVTFQLDSQGATAFRARVDAGTWSAPQVTTAMTVSLKSGRHTVQVQAVAANGYRRSEGHHPRRDRRQEGPAGARPQDHARWQDGARRQDRERRLEAHLALVPLVGRPARRERRLRRALPRIGHGAGHLGRTRDHAHRLRAARTSAQRPLRERPDSHHADSRWRTPRHAAACRSLTPRLVPLPAVVPIRVWTVPPGREAAFRRQPNSEDHRARGHYARASRVWSPLRTPDPPLEPQDAPLHLRGAKRPVPDRSAADDRADRDRALLRAQRRRARRQRAVRRHEEADAGLDPRRGDPCRACRSSTTAGSAGC